MSAEELIHHPEDIVAEVIEDYGAGDLAPKERAEALMNAVVRVKQEPITSDQQLEKLEEVGGLVQQEDGLFYGKLLRRAAIEKRVRANTTPRSRRPIIPLSGVSYVPKPLDPKDH